MSFSQNIFECTYVPIRMDEHKIMGEIVQYRQIGCNWDLDKLQFV